MTTYGGGVNSGQMIDWDVAISTGVRWVRPGPQVSLADARTVVAELRELAVAVAEPVHQVTEREFGGSGGGIRLRLYRPEAAGPRVRQGRGPRR